MASTRQLIGNVKGPIGLTPEITIGTVTDLPAGSQPTVTVRGTAANPILDFGIPHGLPGNETIDDAAGEGDVDKVWSADKSSWEISNLKGTINDPVTGLDNKAPVITDSASGSIASFTDGADELPVKELKVGIEPVQDLHGYDHPWPAGGGKNLLNTRSAVNTEIAGVTFTLQKNNDGDVTKISTSGTSEANYTGCFINLQTGLGNLQEGQTYIASINSDAHANSIVLNGLCKINNGQWQSLFALTATEVEFTVPNNITNVLIRACINTSGVNTNGFTAYPMIRLASVTDATFEPYSNICPITGWTGAKVMRTGKNLFDEVYTNISADAQYKAIYVGEGTFTLSTTTPLVSGTAACLFFLPGNVGTGGNSATNGVSAGISRTVQSVDGYVTIGYRTQSATDPRNYNTQLEKGSDASSYEAYTAQTKTCTFPAGAGTVYGGTLTLNQDGTGTLVVDRAEVDLGTLNYEKHNVAQGTLFRGEISNSATVETSGTVANFICSSYPVVATGSRKNKTVSQAIYNTQVDIIDNDYSDTSSFKTAMSGVQLVYELATPVTYTLTAPQVKTLLGLNHIWADTGDTEVTYCADTKLYIDRKITEAVANALNA